MTDQRLQRLLTKKTRRLRVLEQQAAHFGFSTPPHITIEIEDLRAEIEELKAQINVPPIPVFSSPPPPSLGPLLVFVAVLILILLLTVGAGIAAYILLLKPTSTPALAQATLGPTFTLTPTPTPLPTTKPSPTHTTITPLPTPTPIPTPYYVEIVVDASARMSAQCEGGTTKMDAAWQTAGTIARTRAQRGQFVSIQTFGSGGEQTDMGCYKSYPLFSFTNQDSEIKTRLTTPPTPGGQAALVTALTDASAELMAHENIGREIILITGGEDGCGGDLSIFYDSDNRPLWTRTYVILFADQDSGTFINLRAQGAEINYSLVKNQAEAETVAQTIAQATPPMPAVVIPSPSPPPPTSTPEGKPEATATSKPAPPSPTQGVAPATHTPTSTVIQSPTPTRIPSSTPTATNTLTPTSTPPTSTPEVVYDPGSRTITIYPGNAQARTGRLCKGKLADVSRNAVFLRKAYLQQFDEAPGLLATVTHVYPGKSIDISLTNVEVGQYNDNEINADGQPLYYSLCAFNAVQAMRDRLGLPTDLGGFDDPPRWDHGTITIQLSSTLVDWGAKDKSVNSGIFAASDQANMATQAITFRQFYVATAATNAEVSSPGSDDNTSYRIAYDRVSPQHWAGWEIVLPEIDVSSYSRLAFDIKGHSGGEIPNVWLASPPPPGESYDARNYVQIEDYVTVNLNWQRVEIPLDDFQPERDTDPTVDLTHIKGVQILFEWEDMAGMIYVDGFAFE